MTSEGDDEASREGPGGRQRDLLAQHREDRGLEAVGRAEHAQARAGGDERGEARIGPQVEGDRRRVGVEVEPPPDRGGDRTEVRRVGQPHRRADGARRRRQVHRDDGRAARRPDHPGQRALGAGPLEAGHRVGLEHPGEGSHRERGPVCEPHPRRLAGVTHPAGRAGWRGGADAPRRWQPAR